MGYENFSTYTEVDEGDDITVTSSKVQWVNMNRNVTSYVYKDFGAGHFGDLTHDITVQFNSSNNIAHFLWWGLGNKIDDLSGFWSTGGVESLMCSGYQNSGTYVFYARSGSGFGTDNCNISANTPYYCTVTRAGTTMTVEIYTDAEKTSLFDTLSITCTATTLRYLYACMSNDSALAGGNAYGFSQNFDLQEGGADYEEAFFDTATISDDIVFKHKIFIPDTIDVNDSILIKRLLSLSDTVNVNDSILFKRLLNLLDTVDVSDSVSFKHFLNLLDTVDIDDSVSFKHLLNLLDTINVGDSVSFKRLLSLLDTIDVSDSVSFKHLISLLDTVDVSDSASFGNYNFLNLQDTVDVSDSVSFKHLISLLDSIDISDNFAYYSFTVELLKLYLFDAVNVNDSVSFKRLLNLLDTVDVSDAISFKHILNFIESVNIADSISFKHLLNLFDSIHVDDNVLYIKFDEKLYVYLSDLINIDDSVSFKHRINLDDNITIDEAIVVSYLLNLSDTIKIDDSVFGELVLSLQGDSYTVNLPMPQHGGESGSVDNELKLFNFWSDDIEVDTIGIDSEPITIQGVIKSWSDNANADMLIIATKFLNIHDMMKKREEITIKGLGGCFDAVYMIKNFSYNTVKNSPYEYTWNLSLEYVRAL